MKLSITFGSITFGNYLKLLKINQRDGREKSEKNDKRGSMFIRYLRVCDNEEIGQKLILPRNPVPSNS